jgi:hypothetical protein
VCSVLFFVSLTPGETDCGPITATAATTTITNTRDNNNNNNNLHKRWDSSVDIARGYGLDGRGTGVTLPAGARLFSPYRPDRL